MRKISIINLVGRTHGRLAQLGEHLPYKQGVIGSSPIATTIFYGLVVQLVRTLACHARGRRFEPVPGRHFFGFIAQLVEQGTENPCVPGSIPGEATMKKSVTSSYWLIILFCEKNDKEHLKRRKSIKIRV